MTREPDRPADSHATLDDDRLPALVRAGVEEDWRLPPQRLDRRPGAIGQMLEARAGAGAGSPGWPVRSGPLS